jgi:hypothetical protein
MRHAAISSMNNVFINIILMILILFSCSKEKSIGTIEKVEKVQFKTIDTTINVLKTETDSNFSQFDINNYKKHFKYNNLSEFIIDSTIIHYENNGFYKLYPRNVDSLLKSDVFLESKRDNYYLYSIQNNIGNLTPYVFLWHDEGFALYLELILFSDSNKIISKSYLAANGGEGGAGVSMKSRFINDSIFESKHVFYEEYNRNSMVYIKIDSTFSKRQIKNDGMIDTLELYHEERTDSLQHGA